MDSEVDNGGDEAVWEVLTPVAAGFVLHACPTSTGACTFKTASSYLLSASIFVIGTEKQ